MINLEALRNRSSSIAVVGLGYAGTPLLTALQSHFSVYGYDCDERRIRELRTGVDHTRSVTGRNREASSALPHIRPHGLEAMRFRHRYGAYSTCARSTYAGPWTAPNGGSRHRKESQSGSGHRGGVDGLSRRDRRGGW